MVHQKRVRVVLFATLAVGLGTGFLAGLLVGGGDERGAASSAEPGGASERLAALTRENYRLARALESATGGVIADAPARHAHEAKDGAEPSAPATEAVPERYPPGSFERLFQDFAGQMREESVPAGPLGEALLRDPGLLAEAIERLRTERDPETLDILAALLGQVRHPLVEKEALAFAQSPDPLLQAAGLDILDAFDTPAAASVVLPILRNQGDAGVVARAIYALPGAAGTATGDAATIAQELWMQASGADDVEVRRRALIAYGQWGGAEAEAALAGALRSDPAPAARAAAAFALESRRARSAAALAALASVLRDADEVALVRENAFQALRRAGPLPPAVLAAYRAYEAEREGLGF